MKAPTLLFTLALLTAAPTLNAALVVEFSGTPGAGSTSVTFSGGYTTTNASLVNIEINTVGSVNYVNDIGEFTNTYNFTTATLASNSITVTGVSMGTHTIEQLYLDDDGAALDDFAWFSSTAIPVPAGETLTFSGSGVIPLDINGFDTVSDGSVITNASALPIELHFSIIPEPSSLALLGLGGLALLRRRRK